MVGELGGRARDVRLSLCLTAIGAAKAPLAGKSQCISNCQPPPTHAGLPRHACTLVHARTYSHTNQANTHACTAWSHLKVHRAHSRRQQAPQPQPFALAHWECRACGSNQGRTRNHIKFCRCGAAQGPPPALHGRSKAWALARGTLRRAQSWLNLRFSFGSTMLQTFVEAWVLCVCLWVGGYVSVPSGCLPWAQRASAVEAPPTTLVAANGAPCEQAACACKGMRRHTHAFAYSCFAGMRPEARSSGLSLGARRARACGRCGLALAPGWGGGGGCGVWMRMGARACVHACVCLQQLDEGFERRRDDGDAAAKAGTRS
jgi:hypothetical protein